MLQLFQLFQLAMVTFHSVCEGGRKALSVGNRVSIFGMDLELGWSRKSCSYWENNFQTFLLSGISNTSICKVRDVLCWLNVLLTKTFSKIFRGTFCWGSWYLNAFYIDFSFIYIRSFFITINIKWYICWYSRCWGFLSVFSWSWIQFTLIRSHHTCYRHWSRITVLSTAGTVLKHVETLSFKCYCLKQNDQRLIWWFVSIKLIRSFLKFSFSYLDLNYSHCNFNFIRKAIIMLALFCFSCFFPQKSIIFFSFNHSLNKMVKPKCK